MKNLFLACGLIAILYSCSKNSRDDVLVGNWKVVNDSTFNSTSILALGDSIGFTGNYVGQPKDEFNFTSNGTLIVALNTINNGLLSTTDSAKYNMLKNNEVKISNYFIGYTFGPLSHYLNPVESRIYSISNLTTHSATLTFEITHPSAEGAPGIETEIINLKK